MRLCKPGSSRSIRRDASVDGEESKSCKGIESEAGQSYSPGRQRLIRERGRRTRRAWISGWIIRSRCISAHQAHQDSGAALHGKEEKSWFIEAGECLRWSVGGTWWRIIIVTGNQEICGGKENPTGNSSGLPRRDLLPNREVDGRGCALTDIAARVGYPSLHGSRMGGAQVKDWPLQGSGPRIVGNCRSAGSVAEGKHRRCQGKMLFTPSSDGSELCGQRELWLSQRTVAGTSTSIHFAIPTFGSFSSRRRSSLLEAPGSKVGRSGSCTSERARRLSLPAKELRKESYQRAGRSPFSSTKKSCQVQSQGEGCTSSRQCLSHRDGACPQPKVDYVPVEPSSPSSVLPGERASTVVPSAVANSLFRWAVKAQGVFRNFLLSVVAKPKDDNLRPTLKRGGEMHLPFWPMPVLYPEVFTKKVDSDKDWRKTMICMEVLALSWLLLGEPDAAPVEIRLGVPLTPQQWSAVNMLRHLSFDSNTPELVDAKMMSRAAAKFESMEDTIGALHRSLLACDDGGYYGPRFDKMEEFDDSWMRSGALVGRLPGAPTLGAKPVVASRLEFRQAPSFDPVPFFDAETAELFMHPLDHAMWLSEFVGVVPTVAVHGSQKEKIELFKKLADCRRLEVIPKEQARDPFASGLFTVGKNSSLDRLILDATPPNLLEEGKSEWCGSMASCSSLGDILLHDDEVLCCSGLDLKDFFYQFIVGGQRMVRNTLAGAITPSEASYVFGREFSDLGGSCHASYG